MGQNDMICHRIFSSLNITQVLVRKSQIYILLILTMKKKLSVNPIQTRALRPEGAENMSLGSQVSDICF